MKSLVNVFLLVFILLKVTCCEGCWKQEREALIALNSRLGNAFSSLDNTDCCQWEGVECNTTTRRVTAFKLQSNIGPWHLNYSDLIIFKDLKSLYLSSSQISNCSTTNQGLKNLEVLYLGDNNLNSAASILSCLDGLSSLKSLLLSGNMFDATSFHVFQTVLDTLSSKLLHLEILDIGYNNLTNEILPSLRGFRSLKELYLSSIGLDSDLHIQGLSSILKNVEILDLSYNNFNDTDIASALSGLSSLQSLNLQGSEITLRSIYNISKLRYLEILELAGNNFNLWPRENHGFAWPTNLQVLVLRANSLSNNILSSLSGLPRLKSLDLSVNNLKGTLDISGLSTLTNLKMLDFSDNQIVDFVVHKGSKSLSRLDILDLDQNMINGSKLQESLRAFSSINNLTLRQNEFKGTTLSGGFSGLSKLEYLALDHSSNLENEFFKSIGDLPSLKVLSMSDCGINGTLSIGDWPKLQKLEELDLSYNEFVGPLPSSFVNMTSLRTLKLTNNHFIGNIGPHLATLTSLEYLNFEGNQFEFPISFTPFSNHSNLKFIYGNGNKVILDSHSTLKAWVPKFQLQVLQLSSTTEVKSIPLPNFLLYQYNLTNVDFTSCKLKGEFPNWLLENNTKMEMLILQNCSFMGDFHLPSHPHLNMVRVDVSNNAITGQMLSNNISSIFPNLLHLNMSKNAIHGLIPYEISLLSSLVALDLSDNQLSGEIPHNLSRDGSQLSFLRFSNNKLHGFLPPMMSTYSSLQYLLLDGNSLSGSIPSNFFNSSNIGHLDISNNNFIGKIPSQIQNSFGLIEISMSNNHLEGSIPSELAELESLTYLDLSQNNLVGCVPSFINSSATFIHLSNNNLTCLSKDMFGERSSLATLDLSNNEIIDGFHDLIHDLNYTGLNILLVKGNHFTGNIPKQVCQLVDLNILDLSYNDFVGEIPTCLGKMPFENKDPEASRDQYNGIIHSRGDYYNRFGKEKANFTSKKRSETYTTNILIYMSGIDLSHNKLNGSIPYELGNLTTIRALNLSNNFFAGKIPDTFSKLVKVESLDLSFNKLSGQIPPQLSGLTSLEVFSVAHNNLSGATPERKGQFITFDESSYEGNQFLCGPPLPKSCNPRGQEPATLINDLDMDEDDDSLVDMYVFRVSFVVAYTSILLAIATVLCINPYWRQAWFYYIELGGMSCYYFIKDNFCKFF
ncbi:cuscuta receptor 1-like isoform X1 [Cicer arietinum]|uniref:Receptor-like protein 13 isoform X1 n=1 Tax=Cicer arietinum TaxID=3827 RepID=A0A1S2Z3M7_CICAR|nr:receptor-like protein 13 isoform X1 [Cicer arietinum]